MIRVATLADEGHVERIEIGGHAVDRGDGAERADEFVGAAVAHDADGLHRQAAPRRPARSCRRGRPSGSRRDRSRRPGAGCRASRASDLAGHADGEAGSRERMPADEGLSGRPSSRPSARTSSLNSSRSGSTSFIFMRSGRPPTLWCDLMTTEGAAAEGRDALDHVGIERALGQELCRRRSILALSLSNTPMNSRPIVLRLVSGSASPASAPRKALEASTCTRGIL